MTDTLGFLLADVSRLIRRRFDERARMIGATRAQWRALVVVSRNEGINQGGLAELLEVEPITLCRMIDRLEEAGLVERRRDPADRRAWQIFLTDKAGPVLEKVRGIADELFASVVEGIPTADQVTLSRSLERMRENLLAQPTIDSGEALHG
jgi:DNA-binding MarR family transcriptional regulator